MKVHETLPSRRGTTPDEGQTGAAREVSGQGVAQIQLAPGIPKHRAQTKLHQKQNGKVFMVNNECEPKKSVSLDSTVLLPPQQPQVSVTHPGDTPGHQLLNPLPREHSELKTGLVSLEITINARHEGHLTQVFVTGLFCACGKAPWGTSSAASQSRKL